MFISVTPLTRQVGGRDRTSLRKLHLSFTCPQFLLSLLFCSNKRISIHASILRLKKKTRFKESIQQANAQKSNNFGSFYNNVTTLAVFIYVDTCVVSENQIYFNRTLSFTHTVRNTELKTLGRTAQRRTNLV